MQQNQKLTKAEIDERTAILKRLRHLLEQQRAKFREYLSLLEQQETAIKTENVEAVSVQTELEQQIIFNITSLQRVINPMEELYRSVFPQQEKLIPEMKADLVQLQKKVIAQNQINQSLLKTSISSVKDRMSQIKNPYANRKSIYAQDTGSAAIIDISR